MQFLIFLKPLVDMFWQYKTLDIILLYLSLFIFIIQFIKIKNFNKLDFIVIILIFMYTWSFFRETSGLLIYSKVVSCFLYYFLGRIYYNKSNKITLALNYSYLIVVIVNIFLLLQRKGFIYWGDALTFRGMYFFKTDLSAAVCQSIVIFSFLFKSERKFIKIFKKVYIFSIAPLMLILSNSRMYIIIYLILIYIVINYIRERNTSFEWNINLASIAKFGLIICLGIALLALLMNTSVFKNLGLIGFKFNNISDLFNDSNTQGRDKIWSALFQYFNAQDFSRRLFGIDLVTDSTLNLSNDNAHNNYIKVLFSLGYFGIFIFIIFILMLFYYIRKVKERNLFYISMSLLFIFIISGLSNVVIEFTQLTWIPMLYFGMSVSYYCNVNNNT